MSAYPFEGETVRYKVFWRYTDQKDWRNDGGDYANRNAAEKQLERYNKPVPKHFAQAEAVLVVERTTRTALVGATNG